VCLLAGVLASLAGCSSVDDDSAETDSEEHGVPMRFPDGLQACDWLSVYGNLPGGSVFHLFVALPDEDYLADEPVSYTRTLSGGELVIWLSDGGTDADTVTDCNAYMAGLAGTRIEAEGVEFTMEGEPAGHGPNYCNHPPDPEISHLYRAHITLSPFDWEGAEYAFPDIHQVVGDHPC
jgi:hypothetical protein